ncbi:MAG: hypothetical protein K9W43_10690 [Candidatus Thorarchaeota archaeon]|nr:hypothetical protein [Candidatus Thorarchaeota archaeon]
MGNAALHGITIDTVLLVFLSLIVITLSEALLFFYLGVGLVLITSLLAVSKTIVESRIFSVPIFARQLTETSYTSCNLIPTTEKGPLSVYRDECLSMLHRTIAYHLINDESSVNDNENTISQENVRRSIWRITDGREKVTTNSLLSSPLGNASIGSEEEIWPDLFVGPFETVYSGRSQEVECYD